MTLLCYGRRFSLILAATLLSGLLSAMAQSNPKLDYKLIPRVGQNSAQPTIEYGFHSRGNMQLILANNGTIGTFGTTMLDPFTGKNVTSCIYPKNSDIMSLWVGAFWIGAVVGRDTLVSCGSEDYYATSEFQPDVEPLGRVRIRSIDPNGKFYSPEALSEEDITVEYMDTLTDASVTGQDRTDGRRHRPLGIKIRQTSMAWSYSYADDFILFDYDIENVGQSRLKRVYMGIWIDGDMWHTSRNGPIGWEDDIVGFRQTQPAPEGCDFIDTVNIAYHGDNDGDPVGGVFDFRSPQGVLGSRVVRTPSDSLTYSFNWWITNYSDAAADFGPRQRGVSGDPFRDIGTGLGTPQGDRSKYYVMRHPEFDYDLLFTALDHSPQGWLPPPQKAERFAQGYDCRYLLSFGPFDIDPGQRLPVSFAWVGGSNFHRGPTDFDNLFDPNSPLAYYESLDFSQLSLNSRWASWVYDNPGVDTDGDNYFGKFRVCDSVDTFWYEGDGVPDFRGASPPPAPKMKVVPSVGRMAIRWNGFLSENTPDVFLRQADFEGYNVYVARDDRSSSFTLLSSYDREDYNRYRFEQSSTGLPGWVLEEIPFTIESLKLLYGPGFLPEYYTRSNPLNDSGSYYYFAPQGGNVDDLSSPVGIHKVYPEAVDPGPDSTLWRDADMTFEHGVRLPKYYEYEYVLDNLLPTVPYYVAVTALDFGSPKAGLPSLETPPVNNMVQDYALTTFDSVLANHLDVFVWPNPYRIDEDYAGQGYENRQGNTATERARRVHFANLPAVCTISIYSLDGDLIRRIDHNFPGGGPGSMHDSWDLVSRNTQSVVSGLYYWVVESAERTQIGKLVIIK
jgi:hypothetical protein